MSGPGTIVTSSDPSANGSSEASEGMAEYRTAARCERIGVPSSKGGYVQRKVAVFIASGLIAAAALLGFGTARAPAADPAPVDSCYPDNEFTIDSAFNPFDADSSGSGK